MTGLTAIDAFLDTSNRVIDLQRKRDEIALRERVRQQKEQEATRQRIQEEEFQQNFQSQLDSANNAFSQLSTEGSFSPSSEPKIQEQQFNKQRAANALNSVLDKVNTNPDIFDSSRELPQNKGGSMQTANPLLFAKRLNETRQKYAPMIQALIKTNRIDQAKALQKNIDSQFEAMENAHIRPFEGAIKQINSKIFAGKDKEARDIARAVGRLSPNFGNAINPDSENFSSNIQALASTLGLSEESSDAEIEEAKQKRVNNNASENRITENNNASRNRREEKAIAPATSGSSSSSGGKETAAITEFKFAQENGFDGTFEDFKLLGKKGSSRGSSSQRSTQEEEGADAERRLIANTSAVGVLDEIDKTISLIGSESFVTGVSGNILSRVPGTDARTVAGHLKTIKANIGFDKLEALKKASKTGGALGQVTEKEIEFLQAVITDIGQDLDDETLLQNLQKIRRSYMRIKLSSEGIYPVVDVEQAEKLNLPVGTKVQTDDGQRFVVQ